MRAFFWGRVGNKKPGWPYKKYDLATNGVGPDRIGTSSNTVIPMRFQVLSRVGRLMRRVPSPALLFALGLFCLGFYPAGVANGQSLPGDTKFIIRVNVKALKRTEMGQQILAMAKQELMEEIEKESKGEAKPEKLMEMIGFDPFEELQSITIAASEFEKPEESLVGFIQLRGTTGNLEGLAMGLPGYESSKFKTHTIHMASPDENTKVYAAIQSDESGNKQIVVASNRARLEQVLSEEEGGSRSASDAEAEGDDAISKVRFQAKSVVSLRLLELPNELTKFVKDGPQAGITKMLKSLSFDLLNGDEEMTVQLAMSTEKEDQAEQVRQMLQGFIAMMQFAQSADPNDKEMQQIMKYTSGLKAERSGMDVRIEAKVPAADLMEDLQREIGKRTK